MASANPYNSFLLTAAPPNLYETFLILSDFQDKSSDLSISADISPDPSDLIINFFILFIRVLIRILLPLEISGVI